MPRASMPKVANESARSHIADRVANSCSSEEDSCPSRGKTPDPQWKKIQVSFCKIYWHNIVS